MKLTEVGESRVRGYLFVLGRSLRSFLPADVANDALREVESHIRERLEQVEEPCTQLANGALNAGQEAERAAVERVLAELGPPLRVAQAYSNEMVLDEAVTTGRFVPVVRALWHYATTSVFGFVWLMIVITGWSFGAGFILLGLIKIFFPNNVGMFYFNGEFHGAGANFGYPPGTVVYPFGYWIVPVAFMSGLLILVLTQRASRRILGWLRSRKPSARVHVRVELESQKQS